MPLPGGSFIRRMVPRARPVTLLLRAGALTACVLAPLDYWRSVRDLNGRAQVRADGWAERVALELTRAHGTLRAELHALARSANTRALVDAYYSRDPIRWRSALAGHGTSLRGEFEPGKSAYEQLAILGAAGGIIFHVHGTDPARLSADSAVGLGLTDEVPTSSLSMGTTGKVIGTLNPAALLPAVFVGQLAAEHVRVEATPVGGRPVPVVSDRNGASEASAGPRVAAVGTRPNVGPGWNISAEVPRETIGSPFDAMMPTKLVVVALLTASLIVVAMASDRRRAHARAEPDPRAGWVLGWLTGDVAPHATSHVPSTAAAELSHEIRNPLSSLRLNLQGLARDISRREWGVDAGRAVDVCLREIERLDTLARAALGMARASTAGIEAVAISALIGRAAAATSAELSQHNIRLDLRSGGTAHVVGRVGELEGAVINLLLNAAHASPAGGAVRVWAEVNAQARRVQLHVHDDGPGVPPEIEAQIFEPFFTTKPSGGGLGLALAARTAIQHGGSLQLLRTDGGGGHFVLELPTVRERS